MLVRLYKDRRRAQTGTTLIELLVSLTIAGLALSLIVGTISTGLLDATLAKRNTAVEAVIEYEMEQISSSAFSTSAVPYSDCFATENPANPASAAGGYLGTCSVGFTLRADVNCQPTCSNRVQTWTIVISGWPSQAKTGAAISIYKVAHS